MRQRKRYARKLRKHQTPAERKLWALRLMGYRAQAITPSKYVADFYNPLARVVVEVDGGVHKKLKASDKFRDANHKRRGLFTIRVTNEFVLKHPGAAYFKILLLTLVRQFIVWYG